jgi:hypothetical protein
MPHLCLHGMDRVNFTFLSVGVVLNMLRIVSSSEYSSFIKDGQFTDKLTNYKFR